MTTTPRTAGVDLFWIPLGAGGRVVRLNGIVYEAIASVGGRRRPRMHIVHSALVIDLDGRRHTVEMTPVPDLDGRSRGVVVEGPVGSPWLAGLRMFRYEIRRWTEGSIPDLGEAVASPVRITDDEGTTRGIFDALPRVPAAVWGRDQFRTGEMWTCNSVVSWVLTTAGVDLEHVPLPPGSRAPGWAAGRTVAGRAVAGRTVAGRSAP